MPSKQDKMVEKLTVEGCRFTINVQFYSDDFTCKPFMILLTEKLGGSQIKVLIHSNNQSQALENGNIMKVEWCIIHFDNRDIEDI